MLESSLHASPKLRQSKQLPRHRRLARDSSYASTATDDTESILGSQHTTPLASPGAVKSADNGLPPTPPTASQDSAPAQDSEPPPHADCVVISLLSKKSSLSTPVNARSPPTPDPSPPRTTSAHLAPERPPIYAYPSSRGDSFMTAREEPLSSDVDDSRSGTPLADRLSTVEEDQGLGLAFEQDDDEVTPTNRPGPYFQSIEHADATAGAQDKGTPVMEDTPDREWNTDLMRNVTVRRKRRPQSISPQKPERPPVTVVEPASPTPSNRPRRASGLRERVEASSNSPVTPSIENFAHSIGWPSEARDMPGEKHRDVSNKRLSTSSVASTVVSAMVIVTPPRRNQTLRHSGKNMAYRRDTSSSADLDSVAHSHRFSMHSEDVPLHRLVHKRTNVADRKNRFSVGSDMLGSERMMSPSLSLRQRTMDSSAHTLAHQESVRNVLQPAADMLSRSSSVARTHTAGSSYHKRVASAPEAARWTTQPSKPRNFSQLSPPGSPRHTKDTLSASPVLERAESPTLSPKPHRTSPSSRKQIRQQSVVAGAGHPANFDKSLPRIPVREIDAHAEKDPFLVASHPAEEKRVPSGLMERVRRLVVEQDTAEGDTLIADSSPNPATSENLRKFSPRLDSSPPMHRGLRSSGGRSGERRCSSPSQDRASLSPDAALRPSLKRLSTDETVHRSHEWRRPSEEHARVSFDLSTMRSEEHAMARHLYAQGTPFSQFSDTLEVSEATAVSIYPHNNHSLLVVQQVSRGSSMMPEQHQLTAGAHFAPQDHRDVRYTPTPPFVDASEGHEENAGQLPQPTLNLEPSTPPMQIALPEPLGVDYPLQNPRAPPEPPKIMFIPPTPAEELERQLAPAPPGPPERSDSHPQRRLSLVQRARRYSNDLITPLLARTSINRGRYTSDSRARSAHRNPRTPTVNDEDGTLHPFWRPRGFWDGFEDSDSESEEDEGLPQGGDTSDVEDELPERPKRSNTIGNKLKDMSRGSGGFLIGNSLGVERHGTNKRRHHVTLPPHFHKSPRTSPRSSPKVIIQAPTMPLGPHAGTGISKRPSRNNLRGNMVYEYEQPRGRTSWRQGKSLPVLKKYHVQYIGISGVKDRLKERTAEKRREKIRRSIGTRYYVEPAVGPTPSSSSE
ncbi:hypothetical protein EJ02DRAFT_454266 [Clathrospora elynae]|uniref:Uncharacterized protein n=1 Tax=Clathrospora elynae TaxID=706981 RepID=A0A6A5SP68_9PLEO|nr:hypothetical protein EJ02DRAFT_454266 [Clathrospora elynae]